jgi:hypothetical protein
MIRWMWCSAIGALSDGGMDDSVGWKRGRV